MFSKKLNSIKNPKYIYNFFGSITLLCGLIAPDFLMKLFTNANHATFDILFIFCIYITCLLLSFIKEYVFVNLLLAVFFIMEAIQLHHIAYFHMPISPLDIAKIFSEFYEITTTGLSYFKYTWFVLPILIFCYGVALFGYNKLYSKAKHIPIVILIIVLTILSIKPLRAYRKGAIEFFYPSPIRNSLHNTLNSFAFYFFGNNKISYAQKPIYQPYKIIHNQKNKPNNIILIIGESCRFDHMSLYGYHRSTTPFLDSLKNDSKFIYRKGISSSISTGVSLPILMNLMREPGNTDLIVDKKNNLLKLAKDHGYKTFWISAQESKLLYHIGVEYLDVLITADTIEHKIKFKMNGDDTLIDLMKEQLLGQKNFIILHQRNLHSPYEKNYVHRKKEFQKYSSLSNDRKQNHINSYDNAMLFFDQNIKKIFEYFENNAFHKKSDYYILFTADHGELLGENNSYGHVLLNYLTAQVPFFIYTKEGNIKNLPIIQSKQHISHYDIGIILAHLLGYNIINPNEKLDLNRGYIHGNNIFNNYSFIAYQELLDGTINYSLSQRLSSFNLRSNKN